MKKTIILSICVITAYSFAWCMEQSDASRMVQLFKAIQDKKSEQCAQIIAKFPASVNTYHRYNGDSRVLFGEVTPLHVAVYHDDKPSVELLLTAGADCNARTKGAREDTPLHVVKSAAIAQLLIPKGASIQMKNESGWTPLYAALFHPNHRCNIEVAQCLVDAGADVNERIPDDDNGTLLHTAMEMRIGLQDTIIFLLKNGADRTLTNNKGQTALQAIQSCCTLSRGPLDAILECFKAVPEKK